MKQTNQKEAENLSRHCQDKDCPVEDEHVERHTCHQTSENDVQCNSFSKTPSHTPHGGQRKRQLPSNGRELYVQHLELSHTPGRKGTCKIYLENHEYLLKFGGSKNNISFMQKLEIGLVR